MVRLIVSKEDIIMIGLIAFLIVWFQLTNIVSILAVTLFIIPLLMITQLLMSVHLSEQGLTVLKESFLSDEPVVADLEGGSAQTAGNSLIPLVLVNDDFFDTEEEREGAYQHELGHVRNNHMLINNVVTALSSGVIAVFFTVINSLTLSLIVSGTALLVIGLIVGNIRYYQELVADRYAANKSGSIKKLRQDKSIDYSEIHPEPEEFIEAIEDESDK